MPTKSAHIGLTRLRPGLGCSLSAGCQSHLLPMLVHAQAHPSPIPYSSFPQPFPTPCAGLPKPALPGYYRPGEQCRKQVYVHVPAPQLLSHHKHALQHNPLVPAYQKCRIVLWNVNIHVFRLALPIPFLSTIASLVSASKNCNALSRSDLSFKSAERTQLIK